MLRSNPFPRLAVANDPELYIDFDGQATRALKFFINAIKFNEKATGIIIGGYGFGKTHTLKYIASKLEAFGIKTFFIPNPGKRITDLYRIIAERFLEDLHNGLDLAIEDPLLNHVLSLIKGGDEYSLYARLWLVGERIPFNVRAKLGLGPNIDDSRALRYLVSIINAIVKRFKGVALFLDEFEAILALSKQVRATYMEMLRNLIDALPRRTLFIAALTPACWEEMLNLNAALARRLSSFVIYLRSLKRDEVPLLLNLYIKKVDPKLSVYDLFDDSVLEYLYEVSNGNVGEVLRLAAVLVDILILGQRRSKISLDDAKEVLAHFV